MFNKILKILLLLLLFVFTCNIGFTNDFVSEEIINQYNGIVINEKNAQQIADEANTTTFTNERWQEIYDDEYTRENNERQNLVNQYNQAKTKYEQAKYLHKRALDKENSYLKRIVSRDTINYEHDPYNFVGGWGWLHTLSYSSCNLTCWHETQQELYDHADAYMNVKKTAKNETVCKKAFDEQQKILNDFDNAKENKNYDKIAINNIWAKYGDEYWSKIDAGLKPFEDILTKKYQEFCDKLNNAALKIVCTHTSYGEVTKKAGPLLKLAAVVFTGKLPDTKTYTSLEEIHCQKKQKQHRFEVTNEDRYIDIGCNCGHSIQKHNVKCKPGEIEMMKAFLEKIPQDKKYVAELQKEIAKYEKKKQK